MYGQNYPFFDPSPDPRRQSYGELINIIEQRFSFRPSFPPFFRNRAEF
ncbi:hypothetical protein ALIPUT_02226 [Alistipes putredinis DSM 17216]|uniref:Uncharacterized protein n=1 Tax=Alistipes putredinis DSM 17216 TaxID=445970 RepID=B0MYL0_9BACT|nr:hypothetical protein ALIPUT_02226 [Alistipes putredinis DSM 17216]